MKKLSLNFAQYFLYQKNNYAGKQNDCLRNYLNAIPTFIISFAIDLRQKLFPFFLSSS